MPLKTTLEDTQDRLEALLTYANSVTGVEDTSVGDAIETLANGYGQGGSPLPIHLELLATWEADLEEYTGTTTEIIRTDIDTSQFTDVYLLTTVECDGEYDPPELTWEWSGRSVALGGLYKSNHHYNATNSTFDYGGVVRPTTFSELKSGVQALHGITVRSNDQPLAFARLAHATNCPRVMGGHYTVRVYAIRFN